MKMPIDKQRRQLLLGSLGTTLGLICSPSVVWAEVAKAVDYNQANLVFINTLCELVIPTTETPGAREVGVGNFVLFAARHGLKGSKDSMVAVFEKALNDYAKAPFIGLGIEMQNSVLTEIDRNVFSRQPEINLSAEMQTWKSIKSLILLGYYTSEVGASQELRYQLIPGSFQPDVPVTDATRAWSSDWTGVKFG